MHLYVPSYDTERLKNVKYVSEILGHIFKTEKSTYESIVLNIEISKILKTFREHFNSYNSLKDFLTRLLAYGAHTMVNDDQRRQCVTDHKK